MLKAAKLHLKGDYEVCFKQTEEFDGKCINKFGVLISIGTFHLSSRLIVSYLEDTRRHHCLQTL